jgi:two-component system, NarL family, response regulator NreC
MKEFLGGFASFANLKTNETTYYLANQVFNDIHAFVFIFDFEKRMPVWINKYYETKMGYSLNDLEKVTSKEFLNLLHPDSLNVFLDRMVNYNNYLSTDRKTIYKLKTKSGDWINLMISTSVFKRNPDDTIKYLIGYGVEIIGDELHDSITELQKLELKNSHLLTFENLSKRETEIIAYIGNCFTDKEIAEKLKLSINTTKTHRKRIIKKLGLKNTASLVKLAVESGLV